ncbi:hypothetical protein [Tabrizicola caldifontis]|uniref:hypothetical protein n=1 Tax=Tabrizicola caldifontis TaxID=2528036 RepID=UPI001080ECC2|nr:hypothetical protein [Rhodobacter sp. YIM 73028]
MIRLDAELPKGALLDGHVADLSAAIGDCGGIWLHGDDTSLKLAKDGQTIIGWRAMDGRHEALPIGPNAGNARSARTETGLGLRCRAGENCGFHLPDLTDQVETFSMAVFFRTDPQAEARTLLTLNGEGKSHGSGYLFLSDNGDSILVKDTGENLVLDVPRAAGAGSGLRYLVVTVCGDRIALREGSGTVHQARGNRPRLSTPASLFIGARSHRAGLQKTRGDSVIEDVMFWPAVSLLLPRTARDRDQLTMLDRYALWRR